MIIFTFPETICQGDNIEAWNTSYLNRRASPAISKISEFSNPMSNLLIPSKASLVQFPRSFPNARNPAKANSRNWSWSKSASSYKFKSKRRTIVHICIICMVSELVYGQTVVYKHITSFRNMYNFNIRTRLVEHRS